MDLALRRSCGLGPPCRAGGCDPLVRRDGRDREPSVRPFGRHPALRNHPPQHGPEQHDTDLRAGPVRLAFEVSKRGRRSPQRGRVANLHGHLGPGAGGADVPPSPVTCSRIRTVQTIGEGGNILGGFVTILLVILGIVIVVVVVTVVVAVVFTRKKSPPEPPQTLLPSPDPPSASPEEPSGGQFPGPPPSNP